MKRNLPVLRIFPEVSKCMASSFCILQFCVVLVFILTLHCAAREAQLVYLSITTYKVGRKELSRAKAHLQVLTAPPHLGRKRRAEFRAWHCRREQFGLRSRRLTMDLYLNSYLIKVSIYSSSALNEQKQSHYLASSISYTQSYKYLKCRHSAEIVSYSRKTYNDEWRLCLKPISAMTSIKRMHK